MAIRTNATEKMTIAATGAYPFTRGSLAAIRYMQWPCDTIARRTDPRTSVRTPTNGGARPYGSMRPTRIA
ncbi:hypothetical protein Ais01nite_81000 [Asanoa ishikariensis]|nr:hypothetical protein Ais01nite_81000 [Asanoa ishikariensis]